MSVDLIDYTGHGHDDPWYAAALMIWTKRTRTEMSPGGLAEILGWDIPRKIEELRYMANTVPSSWEFCEYTFLVRNVSRVFTHQLVRTRFGVSFAQQAMQVLDVSQGMGWNMHLGPSIRANSEAMKIATDLRDRINNDYKRLIALGCKIEDAREFLPLGINTNITMKCNMRTLCDLMRKRASPRNVTEWDQVLIDMRAEMIKAHPWVTIFVDRDADMVAREFYEIIEENVEDKLVRTNMIKYVDQLLTNIGTGSMGGQAE